MAAAPPTRPGRSLLQNALATSVPVALASLWYLYRVIGVTHPLLLGGLGLALGLGLGAGLALVVHGLRARGARGAAVVAGINVYSGLVLLGAYAAAAVLVEGWVRRGELIGFGAFLTLFGVIIGISDRLGWLDRARP